MLRSDRVAVEAQVLGSQSPPTVFIPSHGYNMAHLTNPLLMGIKVISSFSLMNGNVFLDTPSTTSSSPFLK